MMTTFDYQTAITKRRRSSPARAYLWCVDLPDLTIPPSETAISDSYKAALDDARGRLDGNIDLTLLNAIVTSAETPFFNFDTDKSMDGNKFWYMATHNTISNLSLTFEEQESGLAWRYLDNWRKLIVSGNGRYNPPHFYKRNITIHRLDTVKQIFQSFTYKNCFVSEVSSVGNEYTSNTPLQYTATFVCDKLDEPITIKEQELRRRLEHASNVLGGIEIPYENFKFDGIPAPAIAGVLRTVGTMAMM